MANIGFLNMLVGVCTIGALSEEGCAVPHVPSRLSGARAGSASGKTLTAIATCAQTGL